MSAHAIVQAVVAALVEEVQILLGPQVWTRDSSVRAHGIQVEMRISLQKGTAGWHRYVCMPGRLKIPRARLTDSSHAGPSRHTSMASTPAILQRSGYRRISPALGTVACPERLLRHGEVAG